ncbi:MAG: hypothetical protein ACLPKB_27800 [Xanthobacteraceae bacterium]
MLFVTILLVLLIGSFALGLIRKLNGGMFLPQAGPGEDHLVMDKNGRWWRLDSQTGVFQEAFRRPKRQKGSTMKRFDSKFIVLSGVIVAIGGFLLIDDYVGKFSIVGNAMRGDVLGSIPYRYVLLGSLLLIGFGLFRLWTTDKS